MPSAGQPPRPPNSWILYRADKSRELAGEKGPTDQTSLCLDRPSSRDKSGKGAMTRIVARMWKEETLQVRRWYEDLAEQKKQEHLQLYPGYKYRPRRSTKAAADPAVSGSRQHQVGSSGSSSSIGASTREKPSRTWDASLDRLGLEGQTGTSNDAGGPLQLLRLHLRPATNVQQRQFWSPHHLPGASGSTAAPAHAASAVGGAAQAAPSQEFRATRSSSSGMPSSANPFPAQASATIGAAPSPPFSHRPGHGAAAPPAYLHSASAGTWQGNFASPSHVEQLSIQNIHTITNVHEWQSESYERDLQRPGTLQSSQQSRQGPDYQHQHQHQYQHQYQHQHQHQAFHYQQYDRDQQQRLFQEQRQEWQQMRQSQQQHQHQAGQQQAPQMQANFPQDLPQAHTYYDQAQYRQLHKTECRESNLHGLVASAEND
ncbi:hypothetical protein OC835_001468 [Tilletia horrida]|nr:hypothetical protein OC835_001468 [Tilletia horrida]